MAMGQPAPNTGHVFWAWGFVESFYTAADWDAAQHVVWIAYDSTMADRLICLGFQRDRSSHVYAFDVL